MIETQAPRNPYVKPEITQVKLVAEEAVLADCQGSGGNLSACDGDSCSSV